MEHLRQACAEVARRAHHVQVQRDQIERYAASLPRGMISGSDPAPEEQVEGGPEVRAAFWLTLNAINFGSGWFPTLRKRPGRSGYFTIAAGVRERFRRDGPWSAEQLAEIGQKELARALQQEPGHPLMALFQTSLRDLGRRVGADHDGNFGALAHSTHDSAVALAEQLGQWPSFADTATVDELRLPFLKRAQIAAADLARAGVIDPPDLRRLTMFADNLVPHVLRVDGVLCYAPELLGRINRAELIEPGSREEVEIRACAVHAVELIVAARPESYAAEIDGLLWRRGQDPDYKGLPRHRCRCTAY
jgi:hypothetical protein